MAQNVLGGELQPCSYDPLTGWFRDGCCNTDSGDFGVHTVCGCDDGGVPRFLQVGRQRLVHSTAGHGLRRPEARRPVVPVRLTLGPKRSRRGVAPPVVLESTHARTLEWASLSDLEEHRFTGNTA